MLQSQRPPQMDVVGRQAIADCLEAEALAVLAEGLEVRTVVVVNEEDFLVRLWRIAAQNDVVRPARSDDSGRTRHADNLPLARRKVNK